MNKGKEFEVKYKSNLKAIQVTKNNLQELEVFFKNTRGKISAQCLEKNKMEYFTGRVKTEDGKIFWIDLNYYITKNELNEVFVYTAKQFEYLFTEK